LLAVCGEQGQRFFAHQGLDAEHSPIERAGLNWEGMEQFSGTLRAKSTAPLHGFLPSAADYYRR